MQSKKTKVLIVDDSVSIQKVLREVIESDPDLEVVGAANDAFEAKQMVNDLSPDVITLDVEMPKVSGLRFLEVLMKVKPTPVVMISTLTKANADTTLKALELGAVDYIAKPQLNQKEMFLRYQKMVIKKIRMAAACNIKTGIDHTSPPSPSSTKESFTSNKVLAIGASTGGTEAINYLLGQLPSANFALLIVQHMPAGFTSTFASRLDRTTDFTVVEAQGGELIRPGVAYLAPGDFHMKVIRSNGQLYTEIFKAEKVAGHRPSVDVLFKSVADEIGRHAFATLLTGMGKDGARGLKAIKNTGGFTVVQDESSCVVYGMPRVAVEMNAASIVTPLNNIKETFIGKLRKTPSKQTS
ncbi:chemotaxis response regulator protein-glutamate methylesterase [Marinomonas sp. CT5]|uniref:protein-glutamate methylesterase/protein-glutamine glutaminase n=1 Tax=Marinomonas sp. CT5 TaxID=2066133 RepID=UPI001BB0C2F5|nr:chemotaxis response regulator protein-glutamate methylesterase [Marinomonas sp. CT5]QUX96735.1 chemotaxis response regulator protein-glutamate methylesterase [Marinomonas sp. CT5]